MNVDHKQGQRIMELVAQGWEPDAALSHVTGATPKKKAATVTEPEPKKKPSKYGNVKCEEDGYTFDSLKERARYRELKLLRDAGEITDLELQPVYRLTVQGVDIGKYIGDFRYKDKDGTVILEDVKGREATKTPLYRWKKKHVKAQFGIDIQEL